ncbi:hypothetical protein [Chryseobacterium pennipullorum]|uniref:Uncharacterized protein n=1 Tax=Chryseobacterium pennipullorum TaxID=2258963 RepID=A0A3D9B7N8_9FLAO|nr:hypothetical protein [Chryseobacterium pennipullorum]REC49389.1 hypothetical protein DRF67_02595 [Chryseobacterium pennipullorum]
MKHIFTLLLLFITMIISAQEIKYSDQELQQKLDSIKAEGNLLFSYENSSWISGDLIRKYKKIHEGVGSYLTYKTSDTVKTVFFNKNQNLVLAEYSFLGTQSKPVKKAFEQRLLTETENALKNLRTAIIQQLSDPKYEVSAPEGYSLNMAIIPFNENYKIYLIPGTSQSRVIPFGNDYLFISDKQGKITSSQRFHSRLIPAFDLGEQGSITSSTHSHLKTSPFISATDICTFKLYAPMTKLEEFSIYSTALKTYMKYNYKKDSIAITKKP